MTETTDATDGNESTTNSSSADDGGVTGGFEDTLCNGALTIDVEPIGGGEVRLTVYYNTRSGDRDIVHAGEYTKDVFTKPTQRGTFKNAVKGALSEYQDVDTEAAIVELDAWLSDIAALGEEEQTEMLPAIVQEIINGTESVEIYDLDETVWKVTISFAGRTRTIEFTSPEMTSGSSAPLENKLADDFYELVEIEPEDWQAIRDQWGNQSEVAFVASGSPEDAIADEVLNHVGTVAIPAADRKKLENDMASVWVDEGNKAGYEHAGSGETIVWVQSRLITDALQQVGKKAGYKGKLSGDMNHRGDLYGETIKRGWTSTAAAQFWPFKPDALGVGVGDVLDVADTSPNDEEVEV